MVNVKPVVSLGRTVVPPLLELGLRGPWRKWCYVTELLVEGGSRE